MVVRNDSDSSWNIIGALPEDRLVVDDGSETESPNPAPVEASLPNHTHTPTQPLSGAASSSQQDPNTLQGKKRRLLTFSPSPDGPSVKRLRTSGTSFDSQKMPCTDPASLRPDSSHPGWCADAGCR
jgi:hypothetical protein